MAKKKPKDNGFGPLTSDSNMVKCPECDAQFGVDYYCTIETLWPEYCPFCGAEIDYDKARDYFRGR